MKFLKILVTIIAVLVIIVLAGGLFLPKSFSLSRSTMINAPDSVIFTNITNYNEFLKWNPWSKMEPTAKVTIDGTPQTVGHHYTWNGKETGSGEMKILALQPYREATMELKFIKPQESLAETQFALRNEGEGVKVTWTMSGTNKGVISKWFGFLFMEKIVGKQFEDGLKFLKSKSETGK